MKMAGDFIRNFLMISKLQPRVLLIVLQTFLVTVTAQMNLVSNGTAAQETTYIDGAGISYNANLAIEGPANNNWEDGCSSTAANQTKAWWGLFLPKLAYITRVDIYLRNDVPERMNDFRLYLANGSIYKKSELCYRDTTKQSYRYPNQSIDCDNSPTKNVYFFNRNTFIELCFIEIYGCWKGTWGTNCITDCPSECIDRHCYPQNGSCIWGCNAQECFHGICDAKTDVCTKGCVPGRGGRYCTFYNTVYNKTPKQSIAGPRSPAIVLTDGNTTSCISIASTSSNSYIQIGNVSLIVITGVYLFFGDRDPTVGNHKVYCSNTTDSWVDGTVLYNGEYINEDIAVFAVCKYIIYIPPILNENAQINLCEIEISGCPFGKYGDICQFTCPENCIGSCDLNTGNCLFGCFNGWLGDRCDTACEEGKFGGQCLRDCSVNCLSLPCDHVTGKCKAGCMKGWEGFNCTEECDIGHFGSNCSQTCFGCISNMCNKVGGICKNTNACNPGYVNGKYCNQECDDWYFGINCEKKCNCRTNPCNKFNGACSAEGCDKGWHGNSCDKDCTNGYFGFSCKDFCETCFNNSCDILEGNCGAGCIDGYRGRQCSVPVLADSSVSTQIGLFIGALLLGVFLTVGIISILIRRRIYIACINQEQKSTASNPESNEQQHDNLRMDTTSTYHDLTTPSVSNEYDQINTLYVNQI